METRATRCRQERRLLSPEAAVQDSRLLRLVQKLEVEEVDTPMRQLRIVETVWIWAPMPFLFPLSISSFKAWIRKKQFGKSIEGEGSRFVWLLAGESQEHPRVYARELPGICFSRWPLPFLHHGVATARFFTATFRSPTRLPTRKPCHTLHGFIPYTGSYPHRLCPSMDCRISTSRELWVVYKLGKRFHKSLLWNPATSQNICHTPIEGVRIPNLYSTMCPL